MKKIISTALIIAFCVLVLILTVRGKYSNPKAETINSLEWTDEGPLELSPERGRFALVYSIVEDGTFFFSLPLARFTTPDLGYHNGKYVSLFAPGLSFLVLPGYLIGRYFELSQVGTYLNNALFAMANFILIYAISRRLGAKESASWLGGLVFLFATPAFAYSGSLFQHHVSTFLILSSLYIVIFFSSIWSLLLVWFLIAASLVVDYPNVVILIPVIVVSLLKLVRVWRDQHKTYLKIKTLGIFTVISALIPLTVFLWFNKVSYGNPLALSGTVTRAEAINSEGLPTNQNEITETDQVTVKKTATGFFRSRNLLNGLYVHGISPDRGVLYFTPVIVLGILGIFVLYKKNRDAAVLLTSVILFNIVFYSLWGDPWGGWAFGSRYLVPSYALLSIFLAFALSAYFRKVLFLVLFLVLFVYSVGVNTLGVLTSSRNPPLVEIAGLEKLSGKRERYSFDRNIEMLQHNKTKSFVYNTYLASTLTPFDYYQIVYLSILVVSGALMCQLVASKSK